MAPLTTSPPHHPTTPPPYPLTTQDDRQAGAKHGAMFDLLIRNGLILDGTGGAPVVGDVGIVGDRIEAVGALHGPALHRELELLVRAGLTPMQALVAATRGSSMAMRRSHEIGTLEPGKLADMVLLAADPVADIRNTRRIHRVLKGGESFDPNQLLRGFR